MVCLCIDVLACLLLAPLRWGQVRRMQPAALAERALHNRGQAVLRRAGKPPSSILNPVAPEALTFSFSSMLRHYAGGACCGSTARPQVGHALQRPRVRPQHDVRLSTEAGSAWATSRVASTAHTKTGTTPLPYTNVDRWAILGNRGYCILALGIIHEPYT